LSQKPVVILRAARRDMARYFAWLEAEAGTETAERFLAAADQSFAKLAAAPTLAPKLGSLNPALADIRKSRIDGFENMLVFFVAHEEGILVSRVLHAASDWWAAFGLEKKTP
jgi:plasmid stabilization system protein ParE